MALTLGCVLETLGKLKNPHATSQINYILGVGPRHRYSNVKFMKRCICAAKAENFSLYVLGQ